MITLTLPYPPTVNNLYAVVNGRKVLSKKGREYHEVVADSIRRQLGNAKLGSGRLRYRVVAFMPDRRRRDLSNLIKAFEDAVTKAGLWDDDSQVDSLSFERGHVAPGGSLFIEIEQSDAPQGEIA